ncbi:MAG: RagB/SusD family nutrient uptake outer membrane protein [Bacteroidales bacterium]|nr:RagB/SusD family nutrient uptake outer membrane protein [Bacteroidales bacterium]
MSKTDDNYITKFNQLSGIPVLKISEAYLIAAECTLESDPQKSLDYLNELRVNRGLNPLTLTADIAEEIHKEYRKEFLCEGQMFYYYKRKGYQYIPYWGSEAGNNIYVFPIPDGEIEFNNPAL